jgi:hypothetical protein
LDIGALGDKTLSLNVTKSVHSNNTTLELFILPKDSPINVEGQLTNLTAERVNEILNGTSHKIAEVNPNLANHLNIFV